MLPTPPYVVNGVERGSDMNKYYAIRSNEEGAAFLNFERNVAEEALRHGADLSSHERGAGIHLGRNYAKIMQV